MGFRQNHSARVGDDSSLVLDYGRCIMRGCSRPPSWLRCSATAPFRQPNRPDWRTCVLEGNAVQRLRRWMDSSASFDARRASSETRERLPVRTKEARRLSADSVGGMS